MISTKTLVSTLVFYGLLLFGTIVVFSQTEYKVHVVSPSSQGLRVQTDTPGGAVASFGGFGEFRIDAPGIVGGRVAVTEGGNVGIGTASPTEKLTVAGIVQSTSGGFKFPDGSVQASAAAAGASFIQNTTTQQGGANFNIGGSGQVGGAVGVGVAPSYKLHVVDPANTGLRVQTNSAGGTVASFGGNGAFHIDAPGIVGGRVAVTEGGNVGIGTASPTEKLTVAGIVQSTAGGFKFPDGSVQTTSANATYTTTGDVNVQLPPFPEASMIHLNLPPGTYMLTATVNFNDVANFVFQDNGRYFQCRFSGDSIYAQHIQGLAWLTVTYTSVLNISSGGVDLLCRATTGGDPTYVFARQSRLTAVRIEGGVNVQ